jgi:hypothetical protein
MCRPDSNEKGETIMKTQETTTAIAAPKSTKKSKVGKAKPAKAAKAAKSPKQAISQRPRDLLHQPFVRE